MENAVIGVFDNYTDARDAADAVVAAGLREWMVQITPKEESWVARRAALDERARHAAPGSWSIGEFFRSLFGTDADHEHAHIYSEAMRRGSFLVTVETEDEKQLERVRDLINQFHPVDIEERAAHWRSQGWSRYESQQAPYTDEEIQAERAGITKSGDARLVNRETHVRDTVRSFSRAGAVSAGGGNPGAETERSTIRMSQSDTAAAGGDSLLGGGDSLLGDDDMLTSQTGSSSASDIAKPIKREPEARTSGTMDNAAMRDSTAPDIYTLDSDADYRTHWQKTAGVSEGRYEDFAPAYRFGAALRNREALKRYHSWNHVEPEARRAWESVNSDSAWDKARDAVRYGWEKLKD